MRMSIQSGTGVMFIYALNSDKVVVK